MASTPPDWQMRPPRRPPRTLWSDLAGLWHRFRGLPVGMQAVAVLVAAVLFLVLLTTLFEAEPDTRVAARSTTTLRRNIVTTITPTTLPPLPPGDDRSVRTVVDGDSFEITDGTKIRLIGIDAPDVETSACYSAEATSHLEALIGSKNVRLVYDVTRTDRFGRTLAYVYRLPDGLFVNVAMARDGFATELSTGANNTASADEIMRAVADARTANRGLWQGCQSTTTASRPATTTSATTATPSTTAAPSTTSAPTTSTTAAPSTTSTTVRNLDVVQAGSPCLIPNAQASLADGRAVRCLPEGGSYVWKVP